MSKESDVVVVIGGAVAALLVAVGVAWFLFMARPMSVSVPTLVSLPAPVTAVTARDGTVVRVVADTDAPERASELQLGDKSYALDETGYAEFIRDLAAVSDADGIALVCDASLSTESVHAVMGKIIISKIPGAIQLSSEPHDPEKVSQWMEW